LETLVKGETSFDTKTSDQYNLEQ